MLEVREGDIDKITEMFYRLKKGEIPGPIPLPEDYPQNELRQVVEYANHFAAEYQALAATLGSMSRGDLDITVPTSRMQVIQSLKNLHANLRHLTWKTQQIASGDLNQQVDFMGDFSAAFNSMTKQLREAFARIEQQNQDLLKAHQRMKKDLDAAARVQRTLLPKSFPQVPELRFAWAYRPCDELAGDALNIVQINDDIIGVYLLDVSGHGVPAALLSVTVTRSLNHQSGGEACLVAGPGSNPEAAAPAQVATRLNSLYPMESNGDHYFTMIYGLLDIRKRLLRFTVAGHPAPILARKGNSPQRLPGAGLPIGMIEEAGYDESVISLQPGDRLYLHSDGLTEELNHQREQFGDKRLINAIAEGERLTLENSVEFLVQKVIEWRGEEHLNDDVSILTIGVGEGP